MHRPWVYTSNTFLTVTKDSFLKMLVISHYHLAHLKSKVSDPFFNELFITYERLHKVFVDTYNTWVAAGGIEKGSTATQDDLIHDLVSDLAEAWDIAIQNVYRSGTPEYIALMPQHRKVFQKGAVLERISSVKALSEAIGKDDKLTAVKTSVDSFYTSLEQAFGIKETKQGITKASSQDVEAARVACAIGQFRNLSKLNDKYAEDPTQSDFFFDLATIRSVTQVAFTHRVQPNAVHTIARRSLKDGQMVQLHNTGTGTLQFYSSSQKDQQPTDEKIVVINAGEIKTVTPAELGNDKENPFLMVINKTPNEGSFELEIKKSEE